VRHQCALLNVARSSLYHERRATPEEDLILMRELDELFLAEPAWGSRKIAAYLTLQGRPACRERIIRLRRLMGLETLYRRPMTSLPGPQSQRFPYLLRGRQITRPNEVWCADITYMPMAKGYLYLFAIMDWMSRMVLGWNISNTLDAGFCLECLSHTLAQSPQRPEIFNTDQGVQFTSRDWIKALQDQQIAVSHDGRGRWMDNVFIERLWRSIKHDDIYPKCYADGVHLWHGVEDWFRRYNHVRPHQTLGNITPAMAYGQQPTKS
jgi:putative transposase